MITITLCCRLDQRRRAFIDAARALFLEQGYERTTLGSIVERAGGSLATLYKLFGNKDGLLEAVVFDRAAESEKLSRRLATTRRSPSEALPIIAADLREQLLDPEFLALTRIVMTRSIEDQAFARKFFDRTATGTRDDLVEMFTQWQKDGAELTASPCVLADLFLDVIVSDMHSDAISHSTKIVHSPERTNARLQIFIKGAGLDEPVGKQAPACRITKTSPDIG
ncbi:TetR/AcrR family transcriptional regulator [Tsuneonella suprasediminis]|uniref:TetR/AcrR family transcriptional regulator n=2 Tax=Tsuneonella suprasediminis TaxID=2306996 RepID=A0A419R5H7_9SPHN|nr:TetR/AcrR family transcriptional regulator [Tsuneonella suprasediminis]RJX70759.1 TetR/AcrR family transcriptional regulator [Tsuneonella suprasediminis]